jgi:hypothetical protein
MAAMPTSISHGELRRESHNPAIDANPKEINAARLTCAAVAKPLATKRVGPMRLSSLPLTPSE